jgi:hypothetical protein
MKRSFIATKEEGGSKAPGGKQGERGKQRE